LAVWGGKGVFQQPRLLATVTTTPFISGNRTSLPPVIALANPQGGQY
jgi:hypothetical protein